MNSLTKGRARFLHKIKFINIDTWNTIIRSLEGSPDPWYVEQLLQSVIRLTQNNRITADNWREFATVLSATDTTRFRERLYFSNGDIISFDFFLMRFVS